MFSPVQLRVETPEPSDTLFGFTLQVRPVAGEMLSVRSMVPLNPLTDSMETVEFADEPRGTDNVDGASVSVKSSTVTLTSVVWTNPGSDPVIATEYIPPVELVHPREDVPCPGMEIETGLNVQVALPMGETV